MKRKILILVLLCVFFCIACERKNESDQNEAINENDTLSYNPISQKIIAMDYEKKTEKNLLNSRFQFPLFDRRNLYIDGDTISNEYRLISLEEHSYRVLHEFNRNEGIFPFGIEGDYIYFIHTFYESKEEDVSKRKISRFNMINKTIDDYITTGGLISYGGITKEYIYYSVYDPQSDSYNIYKVKKKRLDINPELVAEKVEEGKIITSEENYYPIQDKKVKINEKEFSFYPESFIIGKLFIQFFINEEGSVSYSVTELKSNDVYTRTGFWGMFFNENKIKFYSENGMEEYEY